MMKIGLLGHGVVGSGVRRIIDEGRTEEVSGLSVKRILVKDQKEVSDERMTLSYADILEDEEIDTVCECMGGLEPAHTFVLDALNHGRNAVTSNKKMLATYLDELMSAAEENHVLLMYEASVGGGIPWISSLNEIRRVDEIESFRGILNGTTNYILSGMNEKDADFDEMLAEAQKLGYAERNPADDIDGMDVRYKTVLSCAAAFDAVLKPQDVPAYGVRYISKEDMAYAKEHGRVIKLIGEGAASGHAVHAFVMPQMLAQNDYFSMISSNINAVECTSSTLGTAGFTGQGAGSLPTAHAVVQDLLNLEDHRTMARRYLTARDVDNHDVCRVFYIRTAKPEVFTGIADQKINEHALLTKKVSLEEIDAILKQDETAFVCGVNE